MEIKVPLKIDSEEVSLLDMHSVLNVLNVVLFEIYNLAEVVEDESPLMHLHHEVQGLSKAIRLPEKALEQLDNLVRFENNLNSALAILKPKGEDQANAVKLGSENLASILAILKVRALELTSRGNDSLAWEDFDPDVLKSQLTDVFEAIQKNSHGAYHFVSNIAHHNDSDYYINLEIDKEEGARFTMPKVFRDIIRDLIANARKYTTPGGRIVAGLYINKENLDFVVEDSGQGIPENEIESLVQFDYRASNAKSRPTRGGGFGLTKAYYNVQKLGGRMFIESPVHNGHGTRIKITLTLPD